MKNTKLIYLNLLIIPASIICFEIISTRISSVIFVSKYASIVILLTILGVGSYFGGKIFPDNPQKRLTVILFFIVLAGMVLFVSYQPLLSKLMAYERIYRTIACFFLILPLGFLLGIPFSTGIQILKQNNLEKFIPWMYGLNGILTVLGSIVAVIISMTFGFNITLLAGLSTYFILFLILYKYSTNDFKKLFT